MEIPENLEEIVEQVKCVCKNPNELVDLVSLRNLLIAYKDEIESVKREPGLSDVDDVLDYVEQLIGRKISDIVYGVLINQIQKEGESDVSGE